MDSLGGRAASWEHALRQSLPHLSATQLGWATAAGAVEERVQRSAVLVALMDVGAGSAGNGQPSEGPSLLVTERSPTMPNHAGQIAFPGGKRRSGDRDLVATALREAREEVGLDPRSVEVLGVAPETYLPKSGFVVATVFGKVDPPREGSLLLSEEVVASGVVPLCVLARRENRGVIKHHSGRDDVAFEYEGRIIWGFTARVIAWLVSVLGLEEEWDRAHIMRSERRSAG